ncbi:hypothetical protein ACPVPU_03445 [Sphingomonas sp. CJ99]
MAAAVAAAIAALTSIVVQPATAHQASVQQPSAAAMKLAQTVNSRSGLLIEHSNAFENGEMRAGLLADADVEALEKDYPGIVAHMLVRMRPVIERQVETSLPDLWQRTALLFDAKMTPEEIEQAYTYYTSPAGQRLISKVHERFDVKPMIAQVLSDPDSNVTTDSIRQGLANTIPSIVAEFSSEDQIALLAFTRTSAFEKIKALNPLLAQTKTEWSNESTPEEDAEIERVVTEAVEQFIADSE